MHLHVALLVGPVVAVFKVTAVLENLWPGLLVTFSSPEVFYVMAPQFSVIVESFLTFLATVLLCIVVNNPNMLVQVAVFLVTEGTRLLLTGYRNIVHRLLVSVQDRFLVEYFVAQVTGVEALVFVQVGELVVTEGTGLPYSQVNYSLVSSKVILFGKCLQANVANMF